MDKVLNLQYKEENNDIVLSWIGKANSYEVYLDGKKIIQTEYTGCLIGGLRANTIYGIKVVAVYDNGKSKPVSINVRTSK